MNGIGSAAITLRGLMEPDPIGDKSIVIEPVKRVTHAPPQFCLDLSEGGLPRSFMWGQPRDVHGASIFSGQGCLLAASNLIIEGDGAWHCESLQHRSHLLSFYASAGFDAICPGPKPRIEIGDGVATVHLSHLTERDFQLISDPVLLATPAEPDNWGRWMVQVLPKLAYFKERCHDRKLLCRDASAWQRSLLSYFGLTADLLISHDPGRTYLCDDIAMPQQTSADGTVSDAERALFLRIGETCNASGERGAGERIFVSRMSATAKNPDYRVLRNEAELITGLAALGFVAVDPEILSFEDQVRVFSNASVVVGLGGAGMFNVVFCRPGAKIVTIESTDLFITGHSGMFSSLELPYGVIYGRSDQPEAAQSNPHLPWTVDVQRVVSSIRGFL